MAKRIGVQGFPWWVYLIGGAVLSGLIVWRSTEDLVLAAIVALSSFLGVGAPVAGVGYLRGRNGTAAQLPPAAPTDPDPPERPGDGV